MVEMRGVEPLSENPFNKLSPSAFRGLFSLCCRSRNNCGRGSFIITDNGAKLSRYSFPAILTPVTESAGNPGRRAALSRESVIVSVSYCFSPLMTQFRGCGSLIHLQAFPSKPDHPHNGITLIFISAYFLMPFVFPCLNPVWQYFLSCHAVVCRGTDQGLF